MRNIDYAALYQQVCEAERRGQWDGLTQDDRTKREIASNKARTISVNQAKVGKGTGKKGVAPTAPPNLAQEHIDGMADKLITDGVASDYESALTILEFCSDEYFNLLLDEQQTPASFANKNQMMVQPKETSSGRQAGRAAFKKPQAPVTGSLRVAPMDAGQAKGGKPPMI